VNVFLPILLHHALIPLNDRHATDFGLKTCSPRPIKIQWRSTTRAGSPHALSNTTGSRSG
jgi:hypothetical protein